MALYLIGDVQGCNAALQRLLEKIDFSASRDTLYVLGDLVNRGPDSAGVLRALSRLESSAQCLLGNHDLHLLALWQQARRVGRRDTAQHVLAEPDGAALLEWLRHRPLAIHRHGWLMVHAGVLPQWSVAQVLALSSEVEAVLRASTADLAQFLHAMYGNAPVQWNANRHGYERLRVIVNALTRLRFCSAEGVMEFSSTESADQAPPGFLPWFDCPGRVTRNTPIAFGHWSTLSGNRAQAPALRNNTLPLDTGCVWGGCLSAAKLGTGPGQFELIQIDCDAAQDPMS